MRFYRRQGAPLTLICVPHAGAGGAAFRRWPQLLPEHVDVAAYTAPGREHRVGETPPTTVAALVADVVTQLRPVIDGPYVVFGHSFGGLLAFEFAREARRLGIDEPLALAVAGVHAPHCPWPRPPVHDRPDEEFLREVQAYGGLAAEVLASAELIEVLLPALRADFTAVETYRHVAGDPLDVPILASYGVRDEFVAAESVRQWARHTTAMCEVNAFAGGHFFAHDDDALRLLGDQLKRLLPATSPCHARPSSGSVWTG